MERGGEKWRSTAVTIHSYCVSHVPSTGYTLHYHSDHVRPVSSSYTSTYLCRVRRTMLSGISTPSLPLRLLRVSHSRRNCLS